MRPPAGPALIGCVVVSCMVLWCLLFPTRAVAVKHRRPFHPALTLSYGFDHDGSGNNGGCTNWGCGHNTCYDGHSGSDFPLGLGNDVLAGADGTVIATHSGCADYGYLGNPCGGKCGNYVKLQHSDGSTTIYCHLKNGTVSVGYGQQVGCGQKLGQSASSGSSTGYHLHFGWTKGSTRDPFSGSCSTGGGWVDQGPYPGKPSAGCETSCECSPGQTQSEGCGNCGKKTRTCGGNCQWGGWSDCEGQGPCAPGALQDQSCCDCGKQSRTCGGGCQWGGWSGCAGPDPPGDPPCDTGKLGVCRQGVVRCVAGCLSCTDTVLPSPEVCDGLDNDCDGPTDEGATTMGHPPPPLAARLVDLSAPGALSPGEAAWVWACFENLGTEHWPAGAAWLASSSAEPGGLWVPGAWSAWNVPLALVEPVPPGGQVTLSFPVRMPPAPSPAEMRFDLTVQGAPIPCPAPGFDLAPVLLAAGAGGGLAAVPAAGPARVAAAGAGGDDEVAASGGFAVAGEEDPGASPGAYAGGCSSGAAEPGAGGCVVLLLLLLSSVVRKAKGLEAALPGRQAVSRAETPRRGGPSVHCEGR